MHRDSHSSGLRGAFRVPQFSLGDRVRVDIPDATAPDFDAYHGRHGEVIQLLVDTASGLIGNPADTVLYRVAFADGSVNDFREHDLRPPIE